MKLAKSKPKLRLNGQKKKTTKKTVPKSNMVTDKTVRTSKLAPTSVATKQSLSNNVATVRVAKRERLTTITSPTGSTGVVYTTFVNAGNLAGGTNSFLSRQAQLFDKYRFRKLIFHYVPVVATSTAGNVILGADISTNDAAPTDAQGMTNLSLGYSEANAWTKNSYRVNVSRCYEGGSAKYVRSGTAQLGSAASLYDTAAFYVFTEGAPSSTLLGYIDVEYDVELIGVNRSPENSVSTLAPAAQLLVTLTGGSITPGGTWNGTVWQTFTGYTLNNPGVNTVMTTNSTVSPTDWGVSPTVTGNTTGAGTFTLPAGTWRIRLTSTVASDTYANGWVQCQGQGITIRNYHGFGGTLSPPSTAYVSTSTVSHEFQVAITASATYALSTGYYYSATSTANKTWNVVFADSTGIAQTYVQLTYLGSV